MSSHIVVVAAFVAAPGLVAASASAGGPAYILTELATPPGASSQAYGISENGTVAGWSGGAALWDENDLVELGVPEDGLAVVVRAVNDGGQAACVGEGNPQTYQGFNWDSGVWTPIGALSGLTDGFVEDIDSAGRIVGRSLIVGPGEPDRAFIWENGVLTDLGTLGGFAGAYGINEIGQVVGTSAASLPEGDQLRGFLWEDGRMTALDPLPPDVATQAFDVNDAGEVVGSSFNYTVQFLTTDQATLWRDGGNEIIDLGVVPAPPGSCSQNPYWHKSIARAINNHGQIVGEAMCISSGAPKAAFLWQDDAMHNLNDLIPAGTDLDLRSARDINDAGQIVGYGITPADEVRAFLLTPLDTCPGDTDGDDAVNVNDLNNVILDWGTDGAANGGDVTDATGTGPPDGIVNVNDLNAVIVGWGACP